MNIVITIIGSVVVFAVVFGFAAYTRYLQHKETMVLAEKGLLSEDSPENKGFSVQRWGMIFSITGLILILVMTPFAWNNIWILFLLGLLPLAFGLGLMIVYVLTQSGIKVEKPAKKTKSEKKEKKPAPAKKSE
jgi:hypothetical protein